MKQTVKWTAEGAVKCLWQSIQLRQIHVTNQGYVCILQAHSDRCEFKVAPRILYVDSSLTELYPISVEDFFCSGRQEKKRCKTLLP